MTERLKEIREDSKRNLRHDPVHMSVTDMRESGVTDNPRPTAELWRRKVGDPLEKLAQDGYWTK